MTKTQLILLILETGLESLSSVTEIGPEAAVAANLIKIIQSAMAAYQTETGTPIDLTQIPQETPLP